MFSTGFNPLSAEPILDIGGILDIFGAYVLEKRAFCLLAPPKQMSFLTISNENIFSKLRTLDWVQKSLET